MVGDDAVRGAAGALGVGVGGVGDGADQPTEQVGFVIVMFALQHRGDAFEAHAGIDRRAREVDAFAALALLELHEDEVPYFDIAVAVGVGAAGRAAGDGRAVVVEEFRTRAAGTGVAHRPEIVRGGDAHDTLFGQARDLAPQVESPVVVAVDGGPEAVPVEPQFAGDQSPRQFYGGVLEIVSEREVPQHLEEGVVARRIPHIVQVVVLAAGAHAFLAGRGATAGAGLLAGEDVLELHHPGVGEQQRRVVVRHQRPRGNDLVIVGGEEVEKRAPDLAGGGCGHGASTRRRRYAPAPRSRPASAP